MKQRLRTAICTVSAERVIALVLAVLIGGPCASLASDTVEQPHSCGATGASAAEAGETFYALARNALERQTYPSIVRYSITMTALDRGVPRTVDYTALYLGRTDVVSVNRFSRQEKERPHVARGTNALFEVTLAMGGSATLFRRQLNKSEIPTEILGVPDLAPNYTFGIARTDRGVQPMGSPDPEYLRVIGSVTTRQRTYRIAYTGPDHIGEADLAHLTLQPVRDPAHNRLREMWLDPRSCLPVRLRVAGNFTTGPTTAVPWTITYRNVDGSTYLEAESADAPLNAAGRTYDGLKITFSEVQTGAPSLLDELNASFARPAAENLLREP
jgi:hypothetical protein